MRKKPLYQFASLTSTGIDKVPLNRVVYLQEKNAELVRVDGDPANPVTPSMTIEQAIEYEHLKAPSLYNKDFDASENEAWYDISEYAFQDLSNVPIDDPKFIPNPYNLPTSRAGDTTFLPLPIYAAAEGTAHPFASRTIAAPSEDGKIYLYQVRTDFKKESVYISTIDDGLLNFNSTSLEYRPPFLADNENIDWIYGGHTKGMHVRIINTETNSLKFAWIDFNEAVNPTSHTMKDLGPIQSGWASIIRIPERNIYVKAQIQGSKYVFTTHDRNLNLLDTVEGLDVDFNNTEVTSSHSVNFSRNYPTYNQGNYATIQYLYYNNRIYITSTGSTYYTYNENSNNRTQHVSYLDKLSFDSNGRNGTYITPANGYPVDLAIDTDIVIKSGNIYWIPKLMFDIYDSLVITRSRLHHSEMTWIAQEKYADSTRYQNYREAFFTDFNRYIDSGWSWTDVIHTDFSITGKSVIRAKPVDFGDKYVICDAAYYDKDNNSVKWTFGLIEGFEPTNPEDYNVKSIQEAIINPRISYFQRNSDGTYSRSKLYDYKNDTGLNIYEYSTPDHLTGTMTAPLIKSLNDPLPLLNAELDSMISADGNTAEYRMMYYKPIPGTDLVIGNIGYSWFNDPTDTSLVSGKMAVCIIDCNTNTVKNHYVEYRSFVDENRSITPCPDRIDQYNRDPEDWYTSCTRETMAVVYDEGNSEYIIYYLGVFFSALSSCDSSAIYFKVGTTGVISSGFGPTVKLTGSACGPRKSVGCYPDDNFTFFWERSEVNDYLASLAYIYKGDPRVALDTGTDATENFASIRGATGFNIYYGKFPVMLAGKFEISQEFTDAIPPLSDKYIYITKKTTGLDVEYRNVSDIPDPFGLVNSNYVYLGRVKSDLIGITDLKVDKITNLGGVVTSDITNRLLGNNLTNNIIEASSGKSLITKEYLKDYDGFMPNPYNLPQSRTGDAGFLGIPAYIDYEGSAYPFRTRDVLQAGTDGWLYMYQVRTNSEKQRVYISKMNPDFEDNPVFTSDEYRPSFLSSTQYIDLIYDSNYHEGGGMCVRISDTAGATKYYWIKFYGSADPVAHEYTDITSIAAQGNYWSIIYIPEKNMYLEAHEELTTTGGEPDGYMKYTMYNSSFGVISVATGYHWGTKANHFKYPSNITTTTPGRYHSGYTQLNYYIDSSGSVNIKNFPGYWMPFGTNSLTFDTVETYKFTSSLTRVDPIGGIPTDGWDITGTGPVIRYYGARSPRWYNTKPYFYFDNMYLPSHAATENRLIKYYFYPGMDEETAFQNDYWIVPDEAGNQFTFPGYKNIIPPDNSFVGKSVKKMTFGRFKDGTGTTDLTLTASSYSPPYDPDNPLPTTIVDTNAVITGPVYNNLDGLPTKIEEMPQNPFYNYFEEGQTNTVSYRQTYDGGNSIVEYFDTKSNLISGIPNFTKQAPEHNSEYYDLAVYFLASNGIPEVDITSMYNYCYPIADSDYGLLIVGGLQAYDSNGDGKLDEINYVSGFYIVNRNTGAPIGGNNTYHVTYSLSGGNGYYAFVYENAYVQNISVYKTSTYYYVWFQQNVANRLGGNRHVLGRARIDVTNGYFTDTGEITTYYLPSWYQPAFSIHPNLGFFWTETYQGSYIYGQRHYRAGESGILETWDFNTYPADTVERMASIRSALGFEITFGEYPIMISGHYQQMPFKKIRNLSQNRTYYIYVSVINGKPDYITSTQWLSTTIDRIYIGYIKTDSVGVYYSYITKTYIEKSLVFEESGHIYPISNRNIDFGRKNHEFRNIYTYGMVMRDIDGTGRYWLLRINNGAIHLTQV